MKIDIWMDVMCPYCYIGKKKFDLAIKDFKYKEKLIINWNSFETDPDHRLNFETQKSTMQNVIASGNEFGIKFNFEKLISSNSFNAHRLIQFAKSGGVAGEALESLFINHFSEGNDIDHPKTLIAIGISLGMNRERLRDVLGSGAFSREVRRDERKAKNLGIKNIPFFILNQKQAVHLGQSPEAFLKALNEAWSEFKKHKPYILTEGDSYYSTERKN